MAQRKQVDPRISPEAVMAFTARLFGEELHAKRTLSLAMGAIGVIHAASVAIHAIGRGMARSMGLDPKHATKQVDRLLGNDGITMARLFQPWVQFVVGPRKEIVVALDWTEFDKDTQSTICLYLISRHGRATPLIWKTVSRATLAGKRNGYEDDAIEELHRCLEEDVRVTVLADRGFGDQARYQHLEGLGFDYVIRFRECIQVEHDGETKSATGWLASIKRAKKFVGAKVTAEGTPVPAVVLARDPEMKDPWCLATSRAELSAADITKLYGRRFTIEETFRDMKDIHFGWGLSATHIRSGDRRDRLLMLTAIAYALLVLLGEAGERCGLDRRLKANTVKRRTLSLLNQGRYWFEAIRALPEERVELLLSAYDEVLREHAITQAVFSVL